MKKTIALVMVMMLAVLMLTACSMGMTPTATEAPTEAPVITEMPTEVPTEAPVVTDAPVDTTDAPAAAVTDAPAQN